MVGCLYHGKKYFHTNVCAEYSYIQKLFSEPLIVHNFGLSPHFISRGESEKGLSVYIYVKKLSPVDLAKFYTEIENLCEFENFNQEVYLQR